jgi:small subunit ribosomal protein S17
MEKKIQKRILQGEVVSDAMQKTVVVAVDNIKEHPIKAHDENKEYKIGDKVIIEEMRPLSKDKRWKVIGRIK